MSDALRVRAVNKALNLMGQELVADLSDASLQQSLAATKILRVLDDARDAVLARHGWARALSYVTLQPATLPGYTNFRYPTLYLLPGNALRVWEIDSCAEPHWLPRWQVGTEEAGDGAVLVIRSTQTDALNVAYVRRANWASLDAQIADAVGYEAGARAAYSVTGDQALAEKLAARAENKVLLAISGDATQEGGQPELAPSKPMLLRNMSR